MYKKIFSIIMILMFCVLLTVASFAIGKDDWQYTGKEVNYPEQKDSVMEIKYQDYIPNNRMEDAIKELAIMGAIIGGIIVCNLGFMTYNLISGKKKENESKFRLGLILGIFTGLIFLSIGFIVFKMFNSISDSVKFFVIPTVLEIVMLIVALIYSKKHKIKSGKIICRIVLYPLVVIVAIIIIFMILERGNNVTVDSAGSFNITGTVGSFDTAKSIGGINPMSAYTNINSAKTIGYSVGGAKDINNFRENINNNYLPLLSDVTYEGLFYDYYFDTGAVQSKDEMFYPSYSFAQSKDPISNEDEYYLSVGLNSNIKEEDFSRKKLNLVVLLDISGSMDSSFNSYYYDKVNTYYTDIYDQYNYDKLGDIAKAYNLEIEPPKELVEEKAIPADEFKTKMQIADESVNVLIDQLNEDDRFGLVLFESDAKVAKPLNAVKDVDMDKIKNHILTIGAEGGTNFEDGYVKATKLFDEYLDVDQNEYENRIIILTDAMPNIGNTYSNGLFEYVKQNAEDKISTTFIGIGVDFNSELVEEISKVKGANYYSVHDSASFKSRMGEQFEYMVTPLVYDLQMKLTSNDYSIEKVYGTNEADKATGEIMYVNTLFPSKSDDTGEVKGGLILIKLKKNGNTGSLMNLSVSYKDRSENKYLSNEEVIIPEHNGEYFANTGIRKGIALTRYVNLLKSWLLYEKSNDTKYIINDKEGIEDFNYTDEQIRTILNGWERPSEELKVSSKYKEEFKKFKKYLESEISQIGDETMNQEVKLIDQLIK